MEFFDKIRNTLSSPLKSHGADSRDLKTWTLPAQQLKIDNIRLLLYRDCDRRGRKCLFDSAHIVKDSKTGKFTYIPVTNTGQVKDLSEWIFGCVPLSSSSTKRFHRSKGNLIWSKTFQAPATASRCRTGNKTACSSSSSCLSSNGDLTSSGYMSGSGMDDSSYDQSSTDSSRNWSVPVMSEANKSDIKMSHSLPSRLEGPASKMILGLAIVISLDDENDDDDHDSERRLDRQQLAAYITCISNSMELSTDWFSTVAIRSYMNPPTFVQTLYSFSEEYRQMFFSRLTVPLISINSIPVSLKSLPASAAEFITMYMTNDLSWLKSHPASSRCKIVIVGGPKRFQEVKSIFLLLKLLNQCSCGRSSASSSSSSQPPVSVIKPQTNLLQYGVPENQMVSSLSQILGFRSHSPSSGAVIFEKIPEGDGSPTKDEVGVDAVALDPEDFVRRTENLKLLTRDSTKDSGISSAISSTTSLKRSSTSAKFVSNLPPSIESMDSKSGDSDYGVCFHLGEESDTEQTFNTLGLSEPDPNKLKQPGAVAFFGSMGSVGGSSNSSRMSPAMSDETSDNLDSFDMLEDCLDTPREPIKVDLNLSCPKKLIKFCPCCDSVSAVDKFNPLFRIQWLKCAPGSSSSNTSSSNFSGLANNSTSSTATGGSGDPILGEWLNLGDDNWIVYNLDKNTVKYYNASSKQDLRVIRAPSKLVANLLENLQVLLSNPKESDIEQVLSTQLEFIKKLGDDFGRRLLQVTTFDVNSMPYVSEDDLSLLFAVAGWRYPELKERFFV